MQVTPENIVHVGNVLAAEAEFMQVKLRAAWWNARVGVAAKDPVSQPTADGFNRKIDALLGQVQAYVETLRAASEQLAQTARSYGHTDAEIARSLDGITSTYGQPAPVLAPPSVSPQATLLRPYLPPPEPPRLAADPSPVVGPPPDGWWVPVVPPATGTAR